MATEVETRRVSLIHPDMFNRVLRKHNISAEVSEGEEGGLKLTWDEDRLSDVMSDLVNQLLMYDMTVMMIMDSNVGRLKDAVADLRNIEELDEYYDREEREEIRQECLETVEGVVNNLNSTIIDYRKETGTA